MAGDQGIEYAAFVQKELEYEHARREAVNTRAASSITSCTALVTIVLAVVAIAKGRDFILAGCDLAVLILALISLLASAILAVLAGLNFKYKVARIDSMERMLGEHWKDHPTDARNQTAYANVKTIESLREGNNLKFGFLIASAIAQVVAIFALGVTAIMIVT